MNLIESACNDSTQDVIEKLIAENASLTRAIQSDDYIVIAAELTDRHNKTRLPLHDNFIDIMAGSLASDPQIISYINTSSGHRLSIAAYNKLDIKAGYAPVYKLLHRHDKNTIITHYQNILSIRINKLSHFDKSRYRALIDILIDSDLFAHKARKPVISKNIYNTMRQLILRRFRITEYEWCFLFNPAISAAFSRHLDSTDARKYGGTYYLHDSPRSMSKIKIYNTDYKADKARQDTPYQFLDGDRLRFEITYKSRFFSETASQLGVNEFKLQQDIFDLLQQYNNHHIKIHLLDKFTGHQLMDILKSASVSSKTGFVDMIKENQSTQVSTDQRINKIESDIAELKETQKILKDEMQSIKDFVDFDVMVDKRKLRAVK